MASYHQKNEVQSQYQPAASKNGVQSLCQQKWGTVPMPAKMGRTITRLTITVAVAVAAAMAARIRLAVAAAAAAAAVDGDVPAGLNTLPPHRLTRKNLARLDILNGHTWRKKHQNKDNKNKDNKNKDNKNKDNKNKDNKNSASIFKDDSASDSDSDSNSDTMDPDRISTTSTGFAPKGVRERQASRDFNHGLSDARPDILEGVRVRALPSHLKHHSLYREEPALAFCHLAVEFMKRDGNFHQATCQAAYDGAVLVHHHHARERAALAEVAGARGANNTPEDGTAAAAAETSSVLSCVTTDG
ncbi:hypothetical protein B0T24DRAFT_599959 [Lasiosphaeria ovina]|uniref:Uncharacterized protein n=1 Tax=Lasiosphaeria ovina TaxID=92902 RepID=A0AAE0JS93_9PEZI|nr:hypothetical protein B0T24DRAFT_599959 [Lasiosphaeria ovina]